jgi:sugar lactone lactonase YvrE
LIVMTPVPQSALSIQALPVPASRLGESPMWHPDEAVLYWCDIPGRALNRFDPVSAAHKQWSFDCEPACCAPLPGGDLLLGMRDGLWRFNPSTGQRKALVDAPYDVKTERFNDGKADPQGRLWVGTIFEPRTSAAAALYCWANGQLARIQGDITVSNGLAFSPDGHTLYWSDTAAHVIWAFALNTADGSLSRRRVFAQFPAKVAGQDLLSYGGRPDGAAVDVQGNYWVAMFEGQRLLQLAADGALLQDITLPVRCPTMPCFGGPDLKTLFITSARENRPLQELAAQPLAGCVLTLRVDVPGLPVNFANA